MPIYGPILLASNCRWSNCTAVQLDGLTVLQSAYNLVAEGLTADTLAAYSLTADTLAAYSLTADTLAAYSLTALQIP